MSCNAGLRLIRPIRLVESVNYLISVFDAVFEV